MEKKNSFLVGSEEWIEEDNLYEENRKKYFDKIKLFLKNIYY
ncbi:hypothetical protein [Fusobacterium mortiferum]|nr:hypothetical protein [Fusobacterium mortiferum]EGR53354.1 hypothetical protein FMAG_02577 [Fusobacterium mortiferum ATCC 9817]